MKFFAAVLASVLARAATAVADDSPARNLRAISTLALQESGILEPEPAPTEAPIPPPTEQPVVVAPIPVPVPPPVPLPTGAPIAGPPPTDAPIVVTEAPVACLDAQDGPYESEQYVVFQFDRDQDDEDWEDGVEELYMQAWAAAGGSCDQPDAYNNITDTKLVEVDYDNSLFLLRVSRTTNAIVENYDPFVFEVNNFDFDDIDALDIYEDDDFDNEDGRDFTKLDINDDAVDIKDFDYMGSCGPILYDAKDEYPHVYWFRNDINDWRSSEKSWKEKLEDVVDNFDFDFGGRLRRLEQTEEVEVCSCTVPSAVDVLQEFNKLLSDNYKIDEFVVGTDQLCNNTYSCDADVETSFSKHGVCNDALESDEFAAEEGDV